MFRISAICVSVGVVAALTLSGSSAQVVCGIPIPNDNVDDRAAIQCLLDRDKHLDLTEYGLGVYNVVTPVPRPPGLSGWPIIKLPANSTLRGAYAATTIKFSGGTESGDWWGLTAYKVSGVTITGISVDTSALIHSNEQTHAVYIRGPAEEITVSGLRINHPRRTRPDGVNIYNGGDCIKITGYPTELVSAKIESTWFKKCQRSGVASTGGSRSLVIDGNTFFDTGDQDIDVEASQTSASVSVTNNHTFVGPNPEGPWSMQFTMVERLNFSGNHLYGRGVHVFNSAVVEMSDSTIYRTIHESGEPVIQLLKSSKNISMSNLHLWRLVNTAGAVVHAGFHTSGYPGGLVMTGNSFYSQGDAALVVTSNSTDLSLVGNRLERLVATGYTNSRAIEIVSGSLTQTKAANISANTILGPFDSAIRLNGSGLGFKAVNITGNIAPDATTGLTCAASAGLAAARIVSSANNWPATVCTGATVSPGA